MKFSLLLLLFMAATISGRVYLFGSLDTNLRDFSLKFYNELVKENLTNFVFNPLSSQLVLALVLNGARGNTKKQIEEATTLPSNTTALNGDIQTFLKSATSRDHTLTALHKIFIHKTYMIREDFASISSDKFLSNVEIVDLSDHGYVYKINDWVSKNTNNHIKNILTTKDFNKYTNLLLINALHFKAQWDEPFLPSETWLLPFHVTDKVINWVSMMQHTKNYEFRYSVKANARLLKIPYVGADTYMIIVLPATLDGLRIVEENLSEVLRSYTEKFQYKRIHLTLPKFKWDNNIRMKPFLKKLGIVDLFDSNADLSGMSNADSGSIFVNDILQRNYFSISENGTNADSAANDINDGTLSDSPVDPIEFTVDHPFIFYICTPVGITYVGRVVSP